MSHHRIKHSNRVNHGRFPKPNRAGDQINYHVLKCRPVINGSSPQIQHDHLQVLVEIESGVRYWMTINIRSGNDKVEITNNSDYKNSITDKILKADLPQGFTPIDKAPNGIALDYIREELTDLKDMDTIDENGNIDDVNIADTLTTELVNVFRIPDARLFIFGSRFDDGERFSSYNLPTGIHDIHMNQGSKPPHDGSNGIYQDGALLSYYPAENRWSAVFLKFKSQSEQTDENGN